MNEKVTRPWAHRRRVLYGGGLASVICFFLITGYFLYGYEPSSCFDNEENSSETGVDCGGRCVRICSIDMKPPTTLWSQAFRITKGMYNAVAYVENKNVNEGVANLPYTIKFFDDDGLIAERKGQTSFPPNVVSPIFEGRISLGEREPTRTTIEFDENPIWVPAQLNGERYMTERRELKNSAKKPVLTAVLKNESLDEARDVDVVATIFNVEGTAVTASRTKIQLFPGRATKQVTFTWQEPIATTVRSCEVPTDVLVAIDLSGSMNNDGDAPPEPITSVLTAARAFVLRLNPDDQVGLVTFATDAELAAPLTKNHTSIATQVNELFIDPESERGNTNTGAAILQALEEITSSRHNPDARTAVVLLTDGLATAPGDKPEEFAQDAAKRLKEEGIELFTIGLGEELNEEFLAGLATDRQHYFKAPTTASLDKIYGSVTEALCEQGAAVIDIIPRPSATYAPLR